MREPQTAELSSDERSNEAVVACDRPPATNATAKASMLVRNALTRRSVGHSRHVTHPFDEQGGLRTPNVVARVTAKTCGPTSTTLEWNLGRTRSRHQRLPQVVMGFGFGAFAGKRSGKAHGVRCHSESGSSASSIEFIT